MTTRRTTELERPMPQPGMPKSMIRIRPWRHLAAKFSLPLFCGVFLVLTATGTVSETATEDARRVYLDCVTETTEEYAGVEFKYTIDQAANTLSVSRWGEPIDVRFGPVYITYRTLGMALKMNVSINRQTWQFTMLHEGGVFVVNGSCKEATRP